MAETLENKVLHALGQVIDHDSDQNIVSLGLVKDITTDEGKVSCVLEFNEIDQKKNEKIFEDSKKAINEIPGVTKINIVTTYHKKNNEDSNDDTSISSELEQPQPENMGTSKIKYIIAVSSAKGGVGKSTVSVNLASAFKHIGLKVCLLDADIYGPSVPKMIGSKHKPESDGKKIETIKKYGLSTMSMGYMVNDENPIIWRGLMVMKAINEMIEKVNWGEADIMIIDMPPGTGDVQLTLTQKINITGSVLVSTPQDMALIDVVRGLKMFEKVKVPIYGIIENMSYFVAPDTGKEYQLYGESKTEAIAEKYDYEILAKLPHDPLLMEQCEKGHPLTDLFPEHKVSQMFIEMAEDILKKIKLNKLSETT